MEEILGGPGSGKTTSSIAISRSLLERGFTVTYISLTNVSIDDVRKRVLADNEFKPEWVEKLQAMTIHSYMLSMIQGTNPGYEVKPVIRNDMISYPDLLQEGGHECPEESKIDWRLLAIREGVDEQGKGKELLIPMDRLMSYIIAFGIEAPQNHALIIDE